MAGKGDKREAILEAMLDLVVERGFHNAPMSLLARRSGASPGVIYHYFPGKDALIHALYQQVKAVKHEAILGGFSPEMTPREAFLHVMWNLYRFFRTHRREVSFLDQYENSPYCGACEDGAELGNDAASAQILAWFRPKKKGGVLKDLPKEALEGLSLGFVARLAKGPKGFSRAAVERITETVWAAIAEE